MSTKCTKQTTVTESNEVRQKALSDLLDYLLKERQDLQDLVKVHGRKCVLKAALFISQTKHDVLTFDHLATLHKLDIASKDDEDPVTWIEFFESISEYHEKHPEQKPS